MNMVYRAEASLLVFREVLEGDLLKFQNISNITDSGGGARDLRLRTTKQPEIKDFLDEMFPNISGHRYRQGEVHWLRNGKEESVNVEYWRPTSARPGELRIATISKILGWKISKDDFNKAKIEGNHLFYLLVMDKDSKVWARIFNSKNLNAEGVNHIFKKKIEEVLKSSYKGTKQGVTRF